MNWSPSLNSVRHDGMFYNKEWNSLLKVFVKYCCVLIAQVEESGIKGRNQRRELLDTTFQQSKCLWLARHEKYPVFSVKREKYLKVQNILHLNEELKSLEVPEQYGLVAQTLISWPHSCEECSPTAHPHNNNNYT